MTDTNEIIDKVLKDIKFTWPICRICNTENANYNHTICPWCYKWIKRLKK